MARVLVRRLELPTVQERKRPLDDSESSLESSGSNLVGTGSAGKRHSVPRDTTSVRVFLQHISKLYETGTVSDCKLISRDGKEFAAHRAILAAWSPVFATMFSTDMTEKASGVCRIENFDGKVVNAMLKFVYTCALPDIGEFVEDMLDIADQYGMPDLSNVCGEYMARNVDVKTAAGYFHLSDRHGLAAAKSKLARFIGDHADQV